MHPAALLTLWCVCQIEYPGQSAESTSQDGGAQAADFEAEAEQLEASERETRRHDRPAEQLTSEDTGLVGYFLLDWGGMRRGLEDFGLEVEFLLTADASWAAAGGAQPGAGALRTLVNLGFTLDTGPALGWSGGTLFAELQSIQGENGSEEIGVLQELSNIDANRRFDLSRVWYEQHLGDTESFLRLGKQDANSLFAYVDSGTRFVHSSMGVSPTLLGLPTYPEAAFGAALGLELGESFELRLGVFDGAAQQGVATGSLGPGILFGSPSDLFWIAELQADWDAGRAAVGAWRHTGRFERFDGGEERGTDGLYLVLEQRLLQDRVDPERGLDAFLQLGNADENVSPFALHVGSGFAWSHPFSERMDDALGVGMSSVLLSDEPGAGFDREHETAFELFYGFQPLPWLRLKPVVQYVSNPGGVSAYDDALVFTLRTTASL